MKKMLFIAVFLTFGFNFLQAQALVTRERTEYGVTAGYAHVTQKDDWGGGNSTDSYSGVYAGVLVELGLGLSKRFNFQPEILYVNAGSDATFLYLPLMVKYNILDTGFKVLAGPQFSYNLEKVEDGVNKLGLDVSVGVEYEFLENFFVNARYGFELTNRYQDPENDITNRFNSLLVGVGYKMKIGR